MRGERGRGRRQRQAPPERRHDEEGRSLELRPSSFVGGVAEVAHVASIEVRDGPIPDAQELARYGMAHPEAPGIILDEFRKQAAHRRDIERGKQVLEEKMLEASIASERLGTMCALGIAAFGFLCATALVAAGHGLEGTVIFGIDVAALVYAFIQGRPRAVLSSPSS